MACMRDAFVLRSLNHVLLYCPSNLMKTMKAMKKSAMKTMNAMKPMKENAKPMKTMKAMKKSATATGHAKLMQAKALNVKSLRMVKEHEKAMHDRSLQPMATMKSKAAMFTEIVMHNEIIEILYDTNWGNMWWPLPAGESADLMRKFRAIESGPKVVRFDYECGSFPRWRMTDGLGPDGEPTANFSYKWDFDNMKQRNMTTHLERNFRIIRMNAMMFA
jgi:hypothetical protein